MRLARGLAAIGGVLVMAAGAAAQEMPQLPQPGPEHKVLKMDEGAWDAVVEMFPPGGAPAMTSRGVEVNTVGCGGLCLISDFKGDLMPGMAFHGHGITTYDQKQKKYVGTWTDSMSTGLATSTGTYDEATKTATGWMEGPDMSGTVVKSKSVVKYTGTDQRVMTMYTVGPDGKEVQTMKISYTRKK